MIAKSYSKIQGTVMVPSAWPEYNSLDLCEHVTQAKTRTCISYCAIIASEPLISAILPQILIASRRNMSRSLEQFSDVMLGVRTHLWVRESAWLTQEVFLEILDLVLDALEPYNDFFDFVLVFDASRVHLSVDISRKLFMAGVRIVVVPAKLTWLLQPLDTHVFANFKNNLRKHLQKVRLNAPQGQLNDRQWIQAVAHCINEMANVDHARSFHRNGMMGRQNDMKAVEKNTIPAMCLNNVGREAPSLEDIQFCLSLPSVAWYDWVVGDLKTTLQIQAALRSGETRQSIQRSLGVNMHA